MQERLLQELERASAVSKSDQAYAHMLYLYHYRGGYNNIASLSCQRVFASITVGACFLICTCLIDWHAVAVCAPGECTVVRPHPPGLIGWLFLTTYTLGGLVYGVIARDEYRLLKRARAFYTHTIGIPDNTLHITEWSRIVEVILTLDASLHPIVGLDSVQTTQLIMRNVNYIIMFLFSIYY